ncbi:hypothetical protein IGI69_002707 [Enterococcus sp. DIV1083b]|uniref:hypothetical protein n=1 Tax=Enterococcus sp. DIV1083b TaxID=2774661 RepID=UPI003F1FC618
MIHDNTKEQLKELEEIQYKMKQAKASVEVGHQDPKGPTGSPPVSIVCNNINSGKDQ